MREPQGSILRPTLVSVYINDVTLVAGDSLIHLYADDTILYTSGHSVYYYDVVYHHAIRSLTKAPYTTHHCDLYALVGWPSLHIRCQTHWLLISVHWSP